MVGEYLKMHGFTVTLCDGGKSLRSAIGVELQRIAKSGERTTGELEAATRAFERLQTSLVRFRTAYARVRLIKGVIAEAEAVLARARAFVPSK